MRKVEPRKCRVEGCAKVEHHLIHGMCAMHDARIRRTGSVGSAAPQRIRRMGNSADSPGYLHASTGYRYVYVGTERLPNGRWPKNLEHRVVMEGLLGRALLPTESVHHINGVRTDNRPENLELWVTAQPSGQRVEDLLRFADEIHRLYGAPLSARRHVG